MIEMAGGTYILEQDPDDESKSSTMSMEMEAFYAQAKDADYIIYNSTVDGELKSRDELLTKSQLLENFKACLLYTSWFIQVFPGSIQLPHDRTTFPLYQSAQG